MSLAWLAGSKIHPIRMPNGSRNERICSDHSRCVGSPSRLTDLPTIAILALGPKGGSSPALLTVRNAKTSLTLSIPIFPQDTDKLGES